MTDPVGVSQDPRRVLLVGDEPDTASELLELADTYAWIASQIGKDAAKQSATREVLAWRIRAALEAQP